MRMLAALLCALLSACGGHSSSSGTTPVPPAAPRIADVTAYLAATVCPDGQFALFAPGCAAHQQHGSDAMTWRRHDLPSGGQPIGQQIEDTFALDDGSGYVTTWDYGPFGPFPSNPANDGGEVYVSDGTSVRIVATQDGGKPGVIQHFTGSPGWLLYRNDAPGCPDWSVVTGPIGEGDNDPSAPATDVATTRYCRGTIGLPFVVAGQPGQATDDVIVAEHYAGASVESAGSMERFILAAGIGRVGWEAWAPQAPSDPTLAQRCPGYGNGVFGADAVPMPGWQLQDCREVFDIAPADPVMTGDQYGWPPAGTSW